MPAATSVEALLRPGLFVDYASDAVPVIVDRLAGKDPAGADLRRRAGCLQLHLCRGKLDPGARRLDRRTHQGLRGDRRCAEPAGAGQHVEIEAHFYSVPYRFARREVEVRLTPRTVEVFLNGQRIAARLRSSGNHRHTTVADHML